MTLDSSFDRVSLDLSKCSKLNMEEKRELVYELSNWPDGASEILQSWSRQEILQILCAEMGKERKYTGLTKLKIIENLLKFVSERKSGDQNNETDHEPQPSSAIGQRTSKRQRKTNIPSQLSVSTHGTSTGNGLGDVVYCKNLACRAILRQEDVLCKRCSCCICYQYDDNKDPSLWLTCSSEPPFRGDSCGMSCHLECALKHENSGITKDGRRARLDGSFYCIPCGKMNDLLGCWRKQLLMAKDTRRVDILCYRVALSQKLLKGTKKYQNLHRIVDEAVTKLEAEVGPLTGVAVKMARGIVNRLSSGPEVQTLCANALGSLDSVLANSVSCLLRNPIIQESNLIPVKMVRLDDTRATSLTMVFGSEDPSPENSINYSIWHRKGCDMDYPNQPICTGFAPNAKFVVSGLTPATEYYFKVVSFNDSVELGMCEVRFSTCSDRDEGPNSMQVERSHSPTTNCSSLSNPSSVEDESNNVTPYSHQNGKRVNNYHSYCNETDKVDSLNLFNDAVHCTGMGAGTPTDPVSLMVKDDILDTPNSDVLKLDAKRSQGGQKIEEMSTGNGLNIPVGEVGMKCVPFVGSSGARLPITPFKLENYKDALVRRGKDKSSSTDLENGTGRRGAPQDGSKFRKPSMENLDESTANGLLDKDFEYYVKILRWLECEGHMDNNFRQKFLTWYSMRATNQEVRIVKVFVDTFMEDPASLAGQLVDTFSGSISNKRLSGIPAGFCMKLWH